MPEFSQPFSNNANKRNLTEQELIRAIRFNIAAEYEAVGIYMQLAESTDNMFVKKVLVDIANEEREHAGEFMRVLKELDSTEFDFYRHGAQEVEAILEEDREN